MDKKDGPIQDAWMQNCVVPDLMIFMKDVNPHRNENMEIDTTLRHLGPEHSQKSVLYIHMHVNSS